MNEITGLHHVTCISGKPQENLDFYTTVLGMRMVKRSVNQDAPDTYHLFYADADGHPGTDITFSVDGAATRHGERALPFTDPHGLRLALVETADAREFTPWSDSPVDANRQVLGLHAVRLWEHDLATTANFLTSVLGFREVGEEREWHRYAVGAGGSGAHLDIRALPDERRGAWGVGGIHHVAWRVADEDDQLAVQARVSAAKRRPTEVIDRFWFKSVYFLEPGGVLFEIATDGPGFTADEDLASLGESLVLPPWLEPMRKEIEADLPVLKY
jgi:glyoxalase family protein